MRKLLATTAALALFAAPAIAQTDDSTGTEEGAGQAAEATTETNGTATQMSTEDIVASQDRVRQTLEKAGMTDVTILDAAYIVQARTPDNESIIMMIDTSGRVMGSQAAPGQTDPSAGTDQDSDGDSANDSDASATGSDETDESSSQ